MNATFGATLDVAHMLATPAPQPDTPFEGLALAAGTCGLLYGPAGVGKSYLALELALSLAAASASVEYDPLGLRPRGHSGDVMLVVSNDPVEVLHQRLWSLGSHLDAADRSAVADHLRLVSASDHLGALANPDFRGRLIRGCEDCRLIVLDDAAHLAGINENQPNQVVKLMADVNDIAIATGAAVLLLHYAREVEPVAPSPSARWVARGSHVFADTAAWVALAYPMPTPEGAAGLRLAEVKGTADAPYKLALEACWSDAVGGFGAMDAGAALSAPETEAAPSEVTPG